MRMDFRFNSPKLKDRRRELRKNHTESEKLLWEQLRNKRCNGLKFWRQYSVGGYILDFYCPQYRLAIELDGVQHAKPEHRSYDEERTRYLESHNVRVLRFWNNEVKNYLESVLQKIYETTSEQSPLLD